MDTITEKVKALDLTNIERKLATVKGWSPTRIRAAVEAYRTFLTSGRGTMVDADADEVWHYHILDTRKYAADCQDVFGRFLNHIPSYDPDSDATCLDCSDDRTPVSSGKATCGKMLAQGC